MAADDSLPRLRALFDYTYKDDYGVTVEIRENDEYFLLNKANEDWWQVQLIKGATEAELKSRRPFYVPKNYVEYISPVYDDDEIRDDIAEYHNGDDKTLEANEEVLHEDEAPQCKPPEPPALPPKTRKKPQPVTIPTSATFANPSEAVAAGVDKTRPASTHGAISVTKTSSSAQLAPQKSSSTSTAAVKQPTKPVVVVDAPPASPSSSSGGEVSPVAVVMTPTRPTYRRSNSDYNEAPTYANLEVIRIAAAIKNKEKRQLKGPPPISEEDFEFYNATMIRQSKKDPPKPDTATTPPVRALPDAWGMYIDIISGRPYYYNSRTDESSWKPPRPAKPVKLAKPVVIADAKLETIATKSAFISDTGSSDGLASSTDSLDDNSDAKSRSSGDVFLSPDTPSADKVPVSIDTISVSDDDHVAPNTPNLPKGYKIETNDCGDSVYTNSITFEKWLSSVDPTGRTYYYKENGGESVWQLPEVSRHNSMDSAMNEMDSSSVSSARRVTTSLRNLDRAARAQSLMASFKPNVPRSVASKACSLPRDLRGPIEHDSSSVVGCGSTAGSVVNTGVGPTSPISPIDEDRFMSMSKDLRDVMQIPGSDGVAYIIKPSDKRALLNKTKIQDGGKKVKKNWSVSYVVLTGSQLVLYKDQKSAQAKASSPIGKPETVIDLGSVELSWGNKDVTSKKNVLQISYNGAVYLLQFDDGLMMHEWYTALKYAQELAFAWKCSNRSVELSAQGASKSAENLLSPPADDTPSSGSTSSSKIKRSSSKKGAKGSTDESPVNKTKIRERLLNFFTRRPTAEVLRAQGILKSAVFGSHINEVCNHESTTVPRFIHACITAIETKGLSVDGIYRLSGNLAQVQKVRFLVDSENDYDLCEAQWDVHVLTGALKLFFRELKEPIIPYDFYDKFRVAMTVMERHKKLQIVKDLVRVLPKNNYDTLNVLFTHLRKVTSFSKENRMEPQNIAIVFGPTLLWQKDEEFNQSMHIRSVFQNTIVEFLLLEYENIFIV
ncbi:rho GTPase-activating protein 12-like isoform X2 [Tubulanus polymorphus]|uniref:rho GTPase-activating protein 12-like isoform X2 n=1 Tax=Tubulanus polymorphus TaxID=672921 RepID=UPI003DA431B3